MENTAYSKYQQTLHNWCKGEWFDPCHAIFIVGVPEGVNVGDIEELMQTVRCWGRDVGGLLVFCECKESIKPQVTPPEVRSDDGTIFCQIVMADVGPGKSTDFVDKLKSFLQAEGKTIDDLQGYVAGSSTPKNAEESILLTMAEVMKQSSRSLFEGHSYRRLRTFSGISPTPLGEE